ncbi:MAG: hypothetical protein ABSG80_10975 [Verrucomicrobiota bacterium]|jgi:hypothetical protein
MKIVNACHIGLVLALLAFDACTFKPGPSVTQNSHSQPVAPECKPTA